MHRPITALIVAALFSAAAEPTLAAEPASAPTTREAQMIERLKAETEVRGLPFRKLDSLDQAITFSRDRGQLGITTPLAAMESTRLLIAEAPGTITMIVVRRPGEGQDPRDSIGEFISFSHRQFGSARWVLEQTEVSAIAGDVTLARSCESDGELFTVQLLVKAPMDRPDPSEPAARLYVSRNNGASRDLDLRLEAPSFEQLCREHPREVDEYVRPIFREFRQESAVFAPDARLAWQVLAEDVIPDADLKARVDEIIRSFDSPDFKVREGAGDALAELGQPAALALMRVNRSALSPQAAGNIDSFLAAYQPLASDEVARLRDDRGFLIDVLNVEDADLRSAAWTRLCRVDPGASNIAPGFDPKSAGAAQRAEVVARLRAPRR